MTLTGFCTGDDIEYEKSLKLFFKAGYDMETIEMVKCEHKILSELQDYDFVPHIVCTRQIKRYYILFMEQLDATSLDYIKWDDPQYKLGIQGTLDILYKLYTEKGFLHRDLDPNNIMINSDNKVYLIDFSSSYLSPTSKPDITWALDFMIFLKSLKPIAESTRQLLNEMYIELYDILCKNSNDPSLYQDWIMKFKSVLFD